MMRTARRIILKAGHVLCGSELKIRTNMAVVVEDGTIKDITPFDKITEQAEFQLLDYSDLFLMPGLIDAHNHLSLDFSLPNYLERMADPLPALVLRAVNNMQADLLAGVTTSRCLGDKGFLDVECRNAIASGTIKGPRLVIAGKGIRSSAGHGFVGYPFDGPAMIRTAVRENIRQNADIIKFYITGTLPSSRGVDCFLSREEVSIIVDEAKRTGRRTAAHCIGGIGFDWCIDAGVDVIEHGYFLTEKQIDTLAQSSAKLVLTPSFFMSAKRIESMPEHLVEPHFRAAGMAKSSMQAIVRSGIPFALGTDGVHGQGAMAAEMSCLVELGASPSTALSAATYHGAAVCDLEKVTGSIDVGRAADLIGVKTNPFVDMETLTDIRCVVFNGEVMKE